MDMEKNFKELTDFEFLTVDGGNWGDFWLAAGGVLMVAASPVIAVVAPPAGGDTFAAGITLLGITRDRVNGR